MSLYSKFITARLDEDTTIPAPVVTALRAIAHMHAGPEECTGCGHTAQEATTPAEQCEQAHEIAAIWSTHPDYPGPPAHRADLIRADRDGSVHLFGPHPLITAGLARATPAGTYLTPRGRALLPTDHQAFVGPSRIDFDWGRDPYPNPVPEVPTPVDVSAYPDYYICGPGRGVAAVTQCPHGDPLTARCHHCEEAIDDAREERS